MPRTIRTTGDYGLDREIDALWSHLSQTADGGFERIVQPIIQQVITNSPEFNTIVQNTVQNYITEVAGVKTIRSNNAPAVSGDIRLLDGDAMNIQQRGTDFTFNVITCDEPGEDISDVIPQTVSFYDQFTEYDPTWLPSHTPNTGTGWRPCQGTEFNPHDAYTDGYARPFAIGKPWIDWTRDRFQHPFELNISVSMGWTSLPANKTMTLLWGSYPGANIGLMPDTRLGVSASYSNGKVTISVPVAPEGAEASATFDYTIGQRFTVRIRLRKKRITIFRTDDIIGDIVLDDPIELDGCAGIATTGTNTNLDAAYDEFRVGGPDEPMAGTSLIPAKCDHKHLGVRSLSIPTQPQMFGNIQLKAGEAIELTQAENAITIARASSTWWRDFLLG